VLGSRTAEILKVGGRSVGAPRIEESLAALDEVAEIAVVGVPDRQLGEVPCAVFVPAAGCDARRLTDGGAGVDLRPDEQPRWFLARRDLPRGPSGKIRRGQLAHEAARWTQSFRHAVVPEHRPYPAFDLEHGVAIVDGCPPAWIGDTASRIDPTAPRDFAPRIVPTAPRDFAPRIDPTGDRDFAPRIDPGARIITLVARNPVVPLPLAVVQAGAAGVDAAVRFVVGPIAVVLPRRQVADGLLDVFAGELVVLAGLLPGPRPRLICAFPAGPRRAFAGAGFAPIAGHAGWVQRRAAGSRDEAIDLGPQGSPAGDGALDAAIEAALAGVAAAAPQLVESARRCAEVAGQRRSAGNDW
jgi:hypothetical protein